MNETLDGDYQRLRVADGAYIREHFFGPDPRLRAMVEHLSDDDLTKLRRGGPRLPQGLRRLRGSGGAHAAPRR